MSREIRFRGWDTRQNVMFSAEEMGQDQLTLSVDGRGFINVSGRSTKLSTFATHIIPMQYIGLKDKDGVDLDWYAGDIIQKGEIIRAITVDWEHGMRFMLGKHILCKQDGINGIKIGDIHQNPELLEGK